MLRTVIAGIELSLIVLLCRDRSQPFRDIFLPLDYSKSNVISPFWWIGQHCDWIICDEILVNELTQSLAWRTMEADIPKIA